MQIVVLQLPNVKQKNETRPVKCQYCGRAAVPAQEATLPEELPGIAQTDFGEVKGQVHVKRSLKVEAAGGHNVLMIGPPGAVVLATNNLYCIWCPLG
jgi:predicted ATPase with chaperone activity